MIAACGMTPERDRLANRGIARPVDPPLPSKAVRRTLLWQQFLIVVQEVRELRELVIALEERVETMRISTGPSKAVDSRLAS